MPDSNQQKWDRRYARDAQRPPPVPAPWLVAQLPQLPQGTALDLACGRGGNAIYLAGHGYAVDAVDVSPVGLQLAQEAAHAAGVKVNFARLDLLADVDISAWQYDLIIMFHFIAPILLGRLQQALRPGGVLMVEQHLQGFAGAAGPGSDRFRVAPGALAQAVRHQRSMQVMLQEEGLWLQTPARTAPSAALTPCDEWRPDADPATPAPFALSRLLARKVF
ncbi:MAG: class I SAM-dependent methyltransferase [bacterium]